MKKIVSIIPFLLFVLHLNAQVLKGTVKDGISGKMLSTVTITNQTTNQKTYTDGTGYFTMTANRGDIVTFDLVGYKVQQYTVPAGLGSVEMHVSLFEMSYDLEEFTLTPKYTPYQLDSMERRSTYSRALARQSGGSVMSPVTLVAEKLSKRSRRLRQFKKNFYIWEEEKFIATRYTPELVQSQTKLRGDTIAHFMNAYPMPYDFARAASELELKVWVREQYQEWLKNPFIPAIDSTLIDNIKNP